MLLMSLRRDVAPSVQESMEQRAASGEDKLWRRGEAPVTEPNPSSFKL